MGLGTLRILEAIRILGLEKKIKFYQASTSELFGDTDFVPQNENTKFSPRSPCVAKLYSYWITNVYRDAYDIFACNGILFNHESPIRGNFYHKKDNYRPPSIKKLGLQDCLYLEIWMQKGTGVMLKTTLK